MIISRPHRNQPRDCSPFALQKASPMSPTSSFESTSPGFAPPTTSGIAAQTLTGGGLITSSSKRPDFHIRSPIGRCQYSSCVGVHCRAQSIASTAWKTRQVTTTGQNHRPRIAMDGVTTPAALTGGETGEGLAEEAGCGIKLSAILGRISAACSRVLQESTQTSLSGKRLLRSCDENSHLIFNFRQHLKE